MAFLTKTQVSLVLKSLVVVIFSAGLSLGAPLSLNSSASTVPFLEDAVATRGHGGWDLSCELGMRQTKDEEPRVARKPSGDKSKGLYAESTVSYVASAQTTPSPDLYLTSSLSMTITTSGSSSSTVNQIEESLSTATSNPTSANLSGDVPSNHGVVRRLPSSNWRPVGHNFDNLQSPHINLINATPYRWRRGYCHSYQMGSWNKAWPAFIAPGQCAGILTNPKFSNFDQDNAGEVVYHLEGTAEPMSFMVQYRNGRHHRVWVKYLDELSTLTNPKHSEHDLGMSHKPGGVGFILGGKEGDFVSNDASPAWMQAQLSHMGHLPLREIVLPMSHHAGSEPTGKRFGLGRPENAQTQTMPLRDQIDRGGVRVLDVRLARRKNEWWEAHGSLLGNKWHGLLGASLKTMVAAVNEFCDENPGELFVWEIHALDAWNFDDGFRPLNDQDRSDLYTALKKLKHRIAVPAGQDITRLPLNNFIGNKRSAVLIRVDESWVRRGHFPGSSEGFVSTADFPVAHRWSETAVPSKMAADQLEHLRRSRPRPDSTLFRSDWLMTQTGLDPAFPARSLLEMSRATWASLYDEMWKGVDGMTYPNWISMDGIEGPGLKAMAMAMNHCLAAKRCGSLGGKVQEK